MIKFKSYKVIIVLLFLSLWATGFSQEIINSAFVEKKTYQLCLDKNWSELIRYGNLAEKKGFDYFYLQERIGIAYYEKKNYSLAEKHFQKALNYNSSDDLVKEYLYYCALFMGKTEQARKQCSDFSSELSEKTGTKNISSVGSVALEGGIKISNKNTFLNPQNNETENYFSPAKYLQLGLNHFTKKNVSLTHCVSFFKQQSNSAILEKNQPLVYSENEIKQLQYYLKINIPIKKNWLLSPAFHLVHKNYTSIKPVIHPAYTDSVFHPGSPPNPLPHPPYWETINHPAIIDKTPATVTSKAIYFVGSLAIQKTMNKFSLTLGTTVSNIDKNTQYINFGGVSFAVWGNSKLIIGCTQYLNTKDNYSTVYGSTNSFLYIEPFKKVSITASYLLNNGNNIIEDNGSLVNNSFDLTNSKLSFIANFYFNKHMALYGLYQKEFKTESIQKFNYNYNLFVVGIKITP